jgi:DNA-binding transcriptional regulator PaaX
MVAVFEDGVRSYLGQNVRLRADAEHWVMSPQQRSPFSFIVVCETLGLAPGAVRTALVRMRAKQRLSSPAMERARPNVSRGNRLVSLKRHTRVSNPRARQG